MQSSRSFQSLDAANAAPLLQALCAGNSVSFANYFRLALFTPFALWGLSKLLVKPEVFDLEIMFAFPGVLVAYIIFVACLLAISFRLKARQLKMLSVFIPLLFVPLAMVGLQGTLGISDAGIVDDTIQSFWLSAGFVLMLGYPMVALAWAIYFLLWAGERFLGHGT